MLLMRGWGHGELVEIKGTENQGPHLCRLLPDLGATHSDHHNQLHLFSHTHHPHLIPHTPQPYNSTRRSQIEEVENQQKNTFFSSFICIWGIWYEELTHLKRPWCWGRLRSGGEGDDRGWDGWMASLTQWTWVWVNSGSWWWTGRPGVLRFMGSQRVGHDWATELNWNKKWS